jgi:hypothetical protein
MKRIKIITSKGELTFEVENEQVLINCPYCVDGRVEVNDHQGMGSSMADASAETIEKECGNCVEGWLDLKELI